MCLVVALYFSKGRMALELNLQNNPNMNKILIVDKNNVKVSGWKKKESIVKFIKKEIENKLK